jgi:LEA14-like dessication related protein
MKPKVTPILLLALGMVVWLGVGGCTTVRPVENVKVSLVNVRLAQSTVWETTAIFTIRVQNERPEDLRLDGGVHKFYLDGRYVGEGLSNERVPVPRLSSVTQDVTVHLRNISVATRIKPIVEQKRFAYRVASVLYEEAGSRTKRWKLENAGELDLRDFMPTANPAR